MGSHSGLSQTQIVELYKISFDYHVLLLSRPCLLPPSLLLFLTFIQRFFLKNVQLAQVQEKEPLRIRNELEIDIESIIQQVIIIQVC